MVGRDGAVGIASALDGKVAMSRAVVQLGGNAMVCEQAAFRSAALQSERLIALVMRHEQTLFAQAQQSTACMAHHEVEARLCRWLLRARDLSGSNKLPFHAASFWLKCWCPAYQRNHGGAHSAGSRNDSSFCFARQNRNN